MSDVPSPIDFHDIAQARAWVEEAVARRPARPRFFDAFAAALNAHFTAPFTVLELGSGPGHLAEQILAHCPARYTALDFSDAMHAIARERLGDGATYLTRDFRDADWADGLGTFDAVVTMQAAHETRHKRRLRLLLARARDLIAPNGLLLYCDHYAGDGKHPDLYAARDEQPEILARAGYNTIRLLHEEGGMALYAADVR